MKKTFILLLLTSCSLFEEPHWEIDEHLEYWVEKFYSEAEQRGKVIQRNYLTVQLNHHVDSGAGESLRGRHTVYIASSFYYDHMIHSKDSLAMEYVIFHELGHALLNKDHVKPYAIMNQCCTTYNIYIKIDSADFRNKMIDKLFK